MLSSSGPMLWNQYVKNSFYQVMWFECLITSVTSLIGAAVHCQLFSVTGKLDNKLNKLRRSQVATQKRQQKANMISCIHSAAPVTAQCCQLLISRKSFRMSLVIRVFHGYDHFIHNVLEKMPSGHIRSHKVRVAIGKECFHSQLIKYINDAIFQCYYHLLSTVYFYRDFLCSYQTSYHRMSF